MATLLTTPRREAHLFLDHPTFDVCVYCGVKYAKSLEGRECPRAPVHVIVKVSITA